jgi:hypothetical protein
MAKFNLIKEIITWFYVNFIIVKLEVGVLQGRIKKEERWLSVFALNWPESLCIN